MKSASTFLNSTLNRTNLVDSDLLVERILDGLHKVRLVRRKVFKLHHTALALDELDDSFRNAALVESILAFLRYLAEGLGQVGQLHELPWEGRLPVEQHLIAIRGCVLDQGIRALVCKAVYLRHWEAAEYRRSACNNCREPGYVPSLGKPDGRL